MRTDSIRWLLASCASLVLMCVSAIGHADAVDDYIEAEMKAEGTPGIALAVVRDGSLLRAKGYGYANLEHRVPMHPDTVFQSASTGKMFTAVAVMLMVEDGKVRLDDSIRRYFPEAPESWQPITVRQILNHISGLDRNPATDPVKQYTDEEMLQVIYTSKLVFPAGERFQYSNIGYDLMGLLVRKLTGEHYVEVLKKRVFEPLGMTTAQAIDPETLIPNRAAGYMMKNDTLVNQDYESPDNSRTGSAGLYMSALDFSKWEVGIRAGKGLKPESWAEVFKPAKLSTGATFPYGLGWFLERPPHRINRNHSGGHLGFRTYFIRYYEAGLAVVLMCNGPTGDVAAMSRKVAALIDPSLAERPGAPITDTQSAVTQRLRKILTSRQMPADEVALLKASGRAGVIDSYAKNRHPYGKLTEVKLFAFEKLGNDTTYHYRARFDRDVVAVMLEINPKGEFQRFTFRPVAAWDEPVSYFP